MCGVIFGLNVDTADKISLLSHRGPDEQTTQMLQVGDDFLSFSHARLAIQDLSSTGRQPMLCDDGRFLAVFNGEIYNHFELCVKHGVETCSSDTRALLRLIAKLGVLEVLRIIEGIFAIVIYDVEDKVVYAARDKFGVKPLYFESSLADGKFLVSSELKVFSLLKLRDREKIFADLMTFRTMPYEFTEFENVFRVRAGEVLILNVHTKVVVQDVSRVFVPAVDSEARARRNLLYSAVEKQLISDVPIGLLLSGGVDSALLLVVMKDLGARPSCFTVGFGDQFQECELSAAEQTADRLKLDWFGVKVTEFDMIEQFDDILDLLETTTVTTSVFPLHFLGGLVAKHNRVVFSGQGVDEIDLGYARYKLDMLFSILEPLCKMSPLKFQPCRSKLLNALRCLASVTRCQYYLSSRSQGYVPGFVDYIEDVHPQIRSRISDSFFHGKLDFVNTCANLDVGLGLADDLLHYTDKIMMAHSVEVRVPFLDSLYASFALAQSSKEKISFTNGKMQHKSLAHSLLPPELVHRKKKSFEVPLRAWLLGDLGNRVFAAISMSSHEFIVGMGQQLKSELKSGRDVSKQILGLYSLVNLEAKK